MKHLFTAAISGVVILLAGNTSYAQTKEVTGDSKALRLGIGLNVGLPTDDLYSVAIGGDARLQKDFSSNVSGIASVGFTSFRLKGDQPANADKSDGIVPVKVGIKVFPVERFYFSGEVGAGFPTADNAKIAFIYAPGLGFGFNNGIDLGLRYEGYSVKGGNLGQVALRVAYGFKL